MLQNQLNPIDRDNAFELSLDLANTTNAQLIEKLWLSGARPIELSALKFRHFLDTKASQNFINGVSIEDNIYEREFPFDEEVYSQYIELISTINIPSNLNKQFKNKWIKCLSSMFYINLEQTEVLIENIEELLKQGVSKKQIELDLAILGRAEVELFRYSFSNEIKKNCNKNNSMSSQAYLALENKQELGLEQCIGWGTVLKHLIFNQKLLIKNETLLSFLLKVPIKSFKNKTLSTREVQFIFKNISTFIEAGWDSSLFRFKE